MELGVGEICQASSLWKVTVLTLLSTTPTHRVGPMRARTHTEKPGQDLTAREQLEQQSHRPSSKAGHWTLSMWPGF